MTVLTPRIEQAGEQRSARVESLRAVAALGVAFGHAFAIAVAFEGIFTSAKNRLLLSGGLGVFLFFTLTGYLLFLPFLRSQVGEGRRVDLGTYARNRALRILPLYYAVVAILLILQPFDTDRSDWWRFALFIENFSRATATRLDSPIWSLVVELHFYVALPLLAWLIARVARRSLALTVAPWIQPEALVALGGFLVVGGAVRPLRDGVLTRVLEWRPLALVSYAFVERPFLRLRRRWATTEA